MAENSIFKGNFFYRGKDVSVTFAQKFGDVLECIHEKEDVSGTKALNDFWESKTWKHMLDLENNFWLKTPEEIYEVYAKEKEDAISKKEDSSGLKTVNVQLKLDAEVKRRMEQVCSELGLSINDAFTIFAKKVSREKRIPFELSVNSFCDENKTH